MATRQKKDDRPPCAVFHDGSSENPGIVVATMARIDIKRTGTRKSLAKAPVRLETIENELAEAAIDDLLRQWGRNDKRDIDAARKIVAQSPMLVSATSGSENEAQFLFSRPAQGSHDLNESNAPFALKSCFETRDGRHWTLLVGSTKQVDEVIDAFLQDNLGGARPLVRAFSRFHFPLQLDFPDGPPDENKGATWAQHRLGRLLKHSSKWEVENIATERPGMRAVEYFSREIRPQLSRIRHRDAENCSTVSFRYTGDLTDALLELGAKGKDGELEGRPVRMGLDAVRIHFNCGRMAILEVAFATSHSCRDGKISEADADDRAAGADAEALKRYTRGNFVTKDEKDEAPVLPWWRNLMALHVQGASWPSLADIARFNSFARFSRLLDFQTDRVRSFKLPGGATFTDGVNDKGFFGGAYLGLLDHILGSEQGLFSRRGTVVDRFCLTPLSDERGFVYSSMVVEGKGLEESGRDTVLSRLGMCDPYSKWSEYAFPTKTIDGSPVMDPDLEAFAYKRYWDWGTYYLISDHSFVMCAARGDGAYGKPASEAMPSFAEGLLHPQHMAFHYHLLVLFSLFIRYRLRAFSNELVEAEQAIGTDWHVLSRTKEEYLHFVATMWNIHPTDQLQGMELFDHLAARLRLRQRIDDLNQRLVEFEQFQSIEAQKQDGMLKSLIYYLGFPIALFALLMPESMTKELSGGFVNYVRSIAPILNSQAQSIASSAIGYTMLSAALAVLGTMGLLAIIRRLVGAGREGRRDLKIATAAVTIFVVLVALVHGL